MKNIDILKKVVSKLLLVLQAVITIYWQQIYLMHLNKISS